MNVQVYLAEGFEEIEAMTAADVLRRAGAEVKLVSIEESRLVTGAHGIRVEADLLFSQTKGGECGMLVLPGGMPGATNLQAHRGLAERILQFAEEGKWLAAICAAPMVFGELGLLKGRKAVCYPGMEEHLKGAELSQEIVAEDGKFITSKGPGTAAEFALKLAEVFCGKAAADAVREGMLL